MDEKKLIKLEGQFEGITEVEWRPDTANGEVETMKVGRFIYTKYGKDDTQAYYTSTVEE